MSMFNMLHVGKKNQSFSATIFYHYIIDSFSFRRRDLVFSVFSSHLCFSYHPSRSSSIILFTRFCCRTRHYHRGSQYPCTPRRVQYKGNDWWDRLLHPNTVGCQSSTSWCDEHKDHQEEWEEYPDASNNDANWYQRKFVQF